MVVHSVSFKDTLHFKDARQSGISISLYVHRPVCLSLYLCLLCLSANLCALCMKVLYCTGVTHSLILSFTVSIERNLFKFALSGVIDVLLYVLYVCNSFFASTVY